MNFPNREELSFRRVRAFPKDSRRGLADKTRCSRVVLEVLEAEVEAGPGEERAFWLVILAKYCMIILVASVFPAPDSPEMIIDWLRAFALERIEEEEEEEEEE